jgi:hypothetical protein
MNPAQEQQHLFARLKGILPRRRRGGGCFRQVNAVRDERDVIRQLEPADGLGFRDAQGTEAAGAAEVFALEPPVGKPFFPARLLQRPRIEHAVGRDQIRPARGPAVIDGGDAGIAPETMRMADIRREGLERFGEARRTAQGSGPGRLEGGNGDRLPRGKIGRGLLIPQAEHFHVHSLPVLGLRQTQQGVEQSPGLSGHGAGQMCGFEHWECGWFFLGRNSSGQSVRSSARQK